MAFSGSDPIEPASVIIFNQAPRAIGLALAMEWSRHCTDSSHAQAGGQCWFEAQLAWYGLPYEVEDLDDLFKSTEARERLRPVNPLAQVPTLVLPDGQVLTESAAITLHLVDATQSTDLVPALGENVRPAFLRWLIFSRGQHLPDLHRIRPTNPFFCIVHCARSETWDRHR